MPKAKNTKPTTKLINGYLAISTVLTSYVVYHTFVLVQDIKYNLQGAPASYALWPAAALALFVFIKPSSYKAKYVAIALLTALTMSVLVWLFGITYFGNSLRTKF